MSIKMARPASTSWRAVSKLTAWAESAASEHPVSVRQQAAPHAMSAPRRSCRVTDGALPLHDKRKSMVEGLLQRDHKRVDNFNHFISAGADIQICAVNDLELLQDAARPHPGAICETGWPPAGTRLMVGLLDHVEIVLPARTNSEHWPLTRR